MSDVLNKASLILIPSGYKDTKLYSQIPENGDGDFTFSRGSNLAATRVNSEGLIEKGRENLTLYSQDFDNASWTKVNATVTANNTTAPDGTNTADLITSTSTNETGVYYFPSVTGINTWSIYAKKGTGRYLLLNTNTPTIATKFDLQDGVIVGTPSTGAIPSIQDVGDGWYRCSITSSTSTNRFTIFITDNTTTNDFGSSIGLTLSIWGAQLEQGLVPTSYIKTTTTTAQAGILEDMPRLDYSGGGCPKLKLEPQRTNLFPQSEYLKDTTHWQVTNVSFSVNQGTSPEGQNNAIKVVPNSTGAAFWLDNTTLTSGQPYVLSFYAKSNGWDYLQVTNSSGVGGSEKENFDIINGTSNGDYATGDAVIEEFGNGWYKIIVKGTANEPTGRMIIALSSGLNMIRLGSVTPSGDDGVLLYGFQWEQGSYSTSYIPTYGSSVTRSADTSINYNNANLPTAYPFTLYVEINVTDTSAGYAISFLDSSVSNFYYTIEYFSNVWHITSRPSGSTSRVSSTTPITLGTHKLLGIYTDTTMTLYLDGTSIASGSNSQSFHSTINDLLLGQLRTSGDTGQRNSIKEVIVFNTELSSDEAIQLTTL